MNSLSLPGHFVLILYNQPLVFIMNLQRNLGPSLHDILLINFEFLQSYICNVLPVLMMDQGSLVNCQYLKDAF